MSNNQFLRESNFHLGKLIKITKMSTLRYLLNMLNNALVFYLGSDGTYFRLVRSATDTK